MTKEHEVKIYYFWDDQGLYAGSYKLKEGDEVHANSTELPAPELSEGFAARWNGADWTIESQRPFIQY